MNKKETDLTKIRNLISEMHTSGGMETKVRLRKSMVMLL